MQTTNKRVLFLLKRNEAYGSYSYFTKNSGLSNSTQMLKQSLVQHFNIEAKIEICVDENSIDREVFLYKPDICLIEAIWTTPKKIKELVKLHPNVVFIIRVHSELPFLANEGIALDWISDFVKIKNTHVAFNSKDTVIQLKNVVSKNVLYLPNLYTDFDTKFFKLHDVFKKKFKKNVIDIGCFGAIRPMKNHLLQATAAIHFAQELGVKLRFHVNAGRVEQRGDNVLKNLRGLFKNLNHELVEHGWMDKEEFMKVIKSMDIGMQCSFNESFNIVTADFVYSDVPIIVSETIDWMPKIAQCDSLNEISMVKKMKHAIAYDKIFTKASKIALKKYNNHSLKEWSCFLKKF